MVRRYCRDCPIEGCGARYLVKLSNHLHDVHGLNSTERRKYLQESKLQPRVKVVIYHDNRGNQKQNPHDCNYGKVSEVQSLPSDLPSWSNTSTSLVYQYSIPRIQFKAKNQVRKHKKLEKDIQELQRSKGVTGLQTEED